LTFTGRSFAWVGVTGASRGTARVYLDGKLLATVNLHRTTTSARSVVFSRTWTASGRRTIVIRVAGTPGHPRVDLDSFLVGS
jgi:hypothetical protein